MSHFAAFTAAMGVCDPALEGHANRVGAHAEAIATRLGWDEVRLDELRLGAALHDVGKIAFATSCSRNPAGSTIPSWRRSGCIRSKVRG